MVFLSFPFEALKTKIRELVGAFTLYVDIYILLFQDVIPSGNCKSGIVLDEAKTLPDELDGFPFACDDFRN
jgi:hypothetical protein